MFKDQRQVGAMLSINQFLDVHDAAFERKMSIAQFIRVALAEKIQREGVMRGKRLKEKVTYEMSHWND